MKAEILRGRSAGVVASLERKTGKKMGGLTGACWMVVVEYLAGQSYRFNAVHSTWDQRSEALRAGLELYDVGVDRRVSNLSALQVLLRQREVAADALMISGRMPQYNNARHGVAVVFDEGNISHIIDSQVGPEGLYPVTTEAEVMQYVRRFDESSLLFNVVPTPEERLKYQNGMDGFVTGIDVAPGVRIRAIHREEGFPL